MPYVNSASNQNAAQSMAQPPPQPQAQQQQAQVHQQPQPQMHQQPQLQLQPSLQIGNHPAINGITYQQLLAAISMAAASGNPGAGNQIDAARLFQGQMHQNP